MRKSAKINRDELLSHILKIQAVSAGENTTRLLGAIIELRDQIDTSRRRISLSHFLDEVASCINNLNGTLSDTRKHEAQLHHDLTRPVRPTRWPDDDCDDDI